jgi:hypothetical protein
MSTKNIFKSKSSYNTDYQSSLNFKKPRLSILNLVFGNSNAKLRIDNLGFLKFKDLTSEEIHYGLEAVNILSRVEFMWFPSMVRTNHQLPEFYDLILRIAEIEFISIPETVKVRLASIIRLVVYTAKKCKSILLF